MTAVFSQGHHWTLRSTSYDEERGFPLMYEMYGVCICPELPALLSQLSCSLISQTILNLEI